MVIKQENLNFYRFKIYNTHLIENNPLQTYSLLTWYFYLGNKTWNLGQSELKFRVGMIIQLDKWIKTLGNNLSNYDGWNVWITLLIYTTVFIVLSMSNL